MGKLDELRSDPDFQALPPADQTQLEQEAYAADTYAPGMQQGANVDTSSMGPLEKLGQYLSPLLSSENYGAVEGSLPDVARSAEGAGSRALAEGVVRPIANAADLVTKVAPEVTAGGYTGDALRDLQAKLERFGPPPSRTIQGQVGEVAAETAVTLGAMALPTKVMGPIGGMAAYEGLRNADQGIVPAAEAAGAGAMFGAVMKGTERFPAIVRFLSNAGVAAVFGDHEAPAAKQVANSLVMGGLGVLSGERAPGGKHFDALDELASRAPIQPKPPPEPKPQTVGEQLAASEEAVANAEGLLPGARHSTPEEVAALKKGLPTAQDVFGARLKGEPEPRFQEPPQTQVDPYKEVGRTGQTGRELVAAAPPPPAEPATADTAAAPPPVLPPTTAPPGQPPEEGPPLTPEQTREGFRGVFGPKEQVKGALGDRIRQRATDDFHALMAGERKLFGGVQAEGAYEAFRRLRGNSEIGDRMIEWGAPTWKPDPNVKGGKMVGFEGEGLGDRVAAGVKTGSAQDLEDTVHYWTARQASELSAQGREKLISPELIKGGLALETPERKAAGDALIDFQKRVADFGQQAGLFSADQRARWNRDQFMWSFNRELGDEPGKARSGGGGAGVFTLKGSERNLRDPLEQLTSGPSRLVNLALENQAKLKLADWAKLPGGDALIRRVSPGVEPVRVRSEDARRAILKGFGNDPTGQAAHDLAKAAFDADPNLPEFLQLWSGRSKPKGDNIMTVFRDGKAEHYELVDPLLVRALDAIHRPGIPPDQKVLRLFNNWKRMAQTVITASPTFLARNGIRDPIAASVFTQTGFQHWTAAARGLKSAIAEDANFRDFIANGGGGGDLRGAEELRRKALTWGARHGLNPRSILTVPADVVRAINHVAAKVELGPRVGEFIRSREQGSAAGHAAYQGREITTDFAMRGDDPTLRMIGQVSPFFTSMVASGDRFYRGLREPDQRAAVATKIGVIATLSTLLHAYNRMNDDFNQLPDWDLAGYWHIPAPAALKGEIDWFRIPKAWEIGAIASSMERMYDSMVGSPSVEDQSLAADIAKIAANNFSISGPPAVQAIAEQYFNKTIRTGSPIVPGGREEMLAPEQYTSRTSPTMRALGSKSPIPFSPARGEALLRSLFAYYGDYGLWASDHLFFPGTTTLHWDDEPVASSFIERAGRYNRAGDQFYEMLGETNAVHSSMMDAAKEGNVGRVQELAQNPDAALSTAFTRAQKVIAALNREISSIQRDPTLGADEKRKLYDDKVRERDGLMKQMVDLGKRVRKETR